jgi:phosphonate transport system substrate-binding protein
MRLPWFAGSSAAVAHFVVLALLAAVPACKPSPRGNEPRYGDAPTTTAAVAHYFAVHPLHNPVKLAQAYQPLLDYLNAKRKDYRFTLEASRDYDDFERKYQARQPDILLPNPWQTLQAMNAGYSVIAMAGEPGDFKGLFIVRKDGGIRTPADLKGKAVSYPSPTALAACIMPQAFLHARGLDVNRDIENRYVGSQESSILNVYLKNTAAGATWPPPWRAFLKDHPREAAALAVAWETESLINNSVMVRDDLPAPTREQLQQDLTGLHETVQGRAILAGMETARFLPASNRDYDVVRAYMERFERDVRKVATR